MIKHIIWDWNGTLIDDVLICVNILNLALQKNRKTKITLEKYRNSFFFPVAKFYASIGLPSFGREYDLLSEFFICEYRNQLDECCLHKGAIGVIKELNSLGLSQSILSAGMQRDLEKFVTHYGLNDWIFNIDGANNIEACGKEDRALCHFSKLGLNPNQVLLVGDTLHDWEVSQLIGCNMIFFEQGHTSKERFRSCNAQSVESLSRIVELVRD